MYEMWFGTVGIWLTAEFSPCFQCMLYALCMAATPENTGHATNVGLMLGQRSRQWTNHKPALGQCLLFAPTSPV